MTDDIRFKITADEQGAVASFKRLRQEILNNEHGLKSIGQEGKMSGKALKDMASFLGPEFQILGDRLDHVSGALQDIKGAGFVAKAALVGLVATAGFQVGQMIGNWVFETEKWKKELDDALALSEKLNQENVKLSQSEVSGMSDEQIKSQLSGIDAAIARSRAEIESYNKAFFQTGEIAGAISLAEQRIKEQQELRKVFMEAHKERMKMQTDEYKSAQLAIELQKQADEAEKERLARVKQEQSEQERLAQAQNDFLASLELEITRLKEGEEAYIKLKLAKQGFTEETIAASLAMKAEIDALKKEQQIKSETKQERDFQAPGMVQATQQRFITRGTGSSVQDKILQEMKQQIKIQQEQLAETRKTNNKLSKIPTEEA
jgi:hypothetical protein